MFPLYFNKDWTSIRPQNPYKSVDDSSGTVMYEQATVSVKLISFLKLCFPSHLNLLTERLRISDAESLCKFSECTSVSCVSQILQQFRTELIITTWVHIRADSYALTRANEHRARGEERSMESGIIVNVDRLKESKEEEILYLTYVTSDHGGVSCLRPRPEEGERVLCLSLRRDCRLPRSLSPVHLVSHKRHRSPWLCPELRSTLSLKIPPRNSSTQARA